MSMSPDQQEQLLKDVAEIKSAIIGNPQFKQRGLAGDVEDLKDWKTGIDGKILWVTGVIVASWFFIGIIAYVGFEWVKTKIGMLK